jgi:hypothetical protein
VRSQATVKTERKSNTMSYKAKYGARAAHFLDLMERYVLDYVNRQNPDLMKELMIPEYLMKYGKWDMVGYEGEYRTNVQAAMRTFPKIAITVHEVIFNGERFAMRYSEHGRCGEGIGHPCAWAGLGLYDWNGEKLTRNATEQDLFALDEQLSTGTSNRVEPPLTSPWDTPPSEPNSKAERVVRDWMATASLTTTKGVLVDSEWLGKPVPQILVQQRIEEVDLFSAGNAVAFYVLQHGTLLSDFATDQSQVGQSITLDVAGLVYVLDGIVASGTIIRNRKALRALLAG